VDSSPSTVLPIKMTKLSIIINQSNLDILKATLDNIGITGITVIQALGCGMQKGHTEYYRGVEFDTQLLPKVKVEIVVCKIPVEFVIDTIKKVLGSGTIGDGKIFVYNVENVIKIRTGEECYSALQYTN
ncbi:MAG TPA: P-II family nitrogen regulator, partial [Clostridium sp.]